MPTAANAARDAIAAWLAGLTFGDSAYALTAVRNRPPVAGEKVTYPMAAIRIDGEYDDEGPVEVTGSRDPSEGDGTYLEKTGEFRGTATVYLFAGSVDQEDELCAGIEDVLVPRADVDEDALPRLLLTASTYYDVPVRVHRRTCRLTRADETPRPDMWLPVFELGVAIPVVRERTAADFLPRVDLTVDGDGEYRIDAAEGTTTEP